MIDLRKAAQELLDSWDMPFNFHPSAHRFEKLRPALAQPDESFCDTHCTWHQHHPDCFMARTEPGPQPEPPLSTGGWDCSEDGKQIFHDDFEFDAKLKVSGDFATDEQRTEFAQMVTKTLNAALAQPEQEPVAYLWQHNETGRTRIIEKDQVWTASNPWKRVGPLYLHPPQRKPLTQEEILALFDSHNVYGSKWVEFARSIEKAHGIQNV
jgi:hypothetical protein